MGYNKNLLLREENNPSDVNIIRPNAKDENHLKKDKISPDMYFTENYLTLPKVGQIFLKN